MLATHVRRFEELSTNQPSPGRSDDASFRDAARWVQKNTPQQDVITQWKKRIEDLVGDVLNQQ